MGNVTNNLTTDESDPGFMTLPRGLGRFCGGLNITSPAYTADREPQINPNTTEPFYEWENPDIMSLSLARAFFLCEIPSNGLDDTQLEAVEVVWHYCVHTYNISVTDNVANTALLESEAKIHQHDEDNGTFVLLDKSGQKKFSASRNGIMFGLQRRIPTTFVGHMSFADSPNLVNVNEFTYQIGSNLMSGILGYNITEQPTERRGPIIWNNLRNITETMALAMTDFMRVNQINGTVIGDALESEIFITVRWPWLSFLAAQIGLTIVFVLAVAACTFNLEVPVIKGSNVAELFAIRKSDMETTTPGTVGGKQAGIDQKIDKQTLGILVRECDTWNLEIHSKE
ncbi:hypothetical protein J3459_006290 [Metarhizium acridum]|nr:hypothetical protein J3459_006290 [Metarhizium acridum]